MAMTVGELREALEDFDEDTEVRLAIQPRYPMQYTVGEVAEVELGEDESRDTECRECGGEGCENCGGSGTVEPDGETHKVVYIAEGSDVREAPYLPGLAARALGW